MSISPEQSVIQVRVDSERESARVLIAEGCDPDTLNTSLLMQYAREQEVSLTAEAEQRLGEIAQDFMEKPRAIDEIFIRAKPVVHGRDGGIEWNEGCNPALVDETTGSEGKEAVDFYNQHAFINVKAGDHLGDIVEPEAGEDGMDVTGGVISAIPGKKLAIEFKDGIKADAQGRIMAGIDGVLILRDDTLRISRLLEVPGCVDFNTGNIDFDGDVMVQDAVRDLFAVRATGNVTVQGLVEGATLVTGGDLVLRRGMAAREKGQIVVERDADIGFLNLVRGRIRGDLVVRKEIVDSDLIVGGNLIADHAAIVGGDTIVTGSLNVGVLGSEAYAPTTITLGVAPLIGVQLMKLNRMEKEVSRSLKQAEKKLSTLGQKDWPEPHEKEEMGHLKETIADLGSRLKDIEPARKRLEKAINAVSTVNAYIGEMVYARVNLRFVDRELQFRETVKGPIKIGWDRTRNLVYRDGGGAIKPLSEITKVVNLAA